MLKDRIQIIILAGGKGKRMQDEMPKVLMKVKGKPMIKHLLESVLKSGVCAKPCIFVSYKKEEVIKELGPAYDYVMHDEQLGTGYAVLCTRQYLEGKSDHVMVLYGDHPFVSPETIKKLIDRHLASFAKITMATVKLLDFKDWRAFFYTNFSRIIRNEKGEILKDVQVKDASDQEKKISEVNPCYFCFEAKWLWNKLPMLKNDNAQKEYYLTDLIKMAVQDGVKIESIFINPHEGLGANSKEELEILERFAL